MTTVRKIEPTRGWHWFQEAWYDTEGARVDFFFVGLIVAALTGIASRLPAIGAIAASFLFPLFHYGTYRFSKEWRTNKKTAISTIFISFQDKELFKRILPLCYLSIAFGFVSFVLSVATITGPFVFAGLIVKLLVHATQIAIMYFAPILLVERSLEWSDAARSSIKTVIDHLPLFVVTTFTVLLFTMLGIATLGIGFLFILPIFVYLPYLIYRSLFEE